MHIVTHMTYIKYHNVINWVKPLGIIFCVPPPKKKWPWNQSMQIPCPYVILHLVIHSYTNLYTSPHLWFCWYYKLTHAPFQKWGIWCGPYLYFSSSKELTWVSVYIYNDIFDIEWLLWSYARYWLESPNKIKEKALGLGPRCSHLD